VTFYPAFVAATVNAAAIHARDLIFM